MMPIRSMSIRSISIHCLSMRSTPFRALALALMLCGGLCWLSGCGNGGATTRPDQDSSSKPTGRRIVATVGMVADIVRQVAGDDWKVESLMGEGVDPHLYKPTRDDVKRLLEADVVFYSGLMLEGRMADTFARVAREGRKVYAVTEGLDEKSLREPPEAGGHWDPHVWMDVALWSQAVGTVARSLCEIDPDGARGYHERADAYQAELRRLDDYCRTLIGSVPREQRVLITAHDAFGYFGRAYDIEVLAIQGISTESEAGVEDIRRLVDQVVDRKIQSIFWESSVNPKSLQALREGASARGWNVNVGGELFSDAMGRPGTYEGTYIGMLDHNASTIAGALGGKVPEGGFKASGGAESSAPQPDQPQPSEASP